MIIDRTYVFATLYLSAFIRLRMHKHLIVRNSLMDGWMSKEMQLIITPTKKKNPFEKSKTIESLYIKNLLELKNKKKEFKTYIYMCPISYYITLSYLLWKLHRNSYNVCLFDSGKSRSSNFYSKLKNSLKLPWKTLGV